MFRAHKLYPNTSKAGIVVSADIPIGTAGIAGSVFACIGKAGIMSGEDKMKKMAKAKEQLIDRIRNVLKLAPIGRVECYNEGSVSTFTTDVGLTNEAFVSCGYKLADADQAQATELIVGALEPILDELKERLQAGQLAPLKP